MKYDDSEYCFLNFETDLDKHAANTHIGMYLAWAMLAGLSREDEETTSWAAERAQLQARQATGARLLSDLCDGKLTDEDFNAEGNLFTSAYYDEFFEQDYRRVFAVLPSLGLRGALRGFVTLLAAVPIVGNIVALFVLMAWGAKQKP